MVSRNFISTFFLNFQRIGLIFQVVVSMHNQVQVNATSSATEKYFSSRGLLFTSRNGKLMDTPHLHMDEWINAIRSNGTTNCNVDLSFEEAVTVQMATMAYRQNRVVSWTGEQVV